MNIIIKSLFLKRYVTTDIFKHDVFNALGTNIALQIDLIKIFPRLDSAGVTKGKRPVFLSCVSLQVIISPHHGAASADFTVLTPCSHDVPVETN